MSPAPALHTACALREVRPSGGWLAAVERLRSGALFWWLDSALPDRRLGRFSYAGCEPYALWRSDADGTRLELRRAVRPDLPPRSSPSPWRGDPLDALRAVLPPAPPAPGSAPPFVGGAVGYLGYEFAERLAPGPALPPRPPEDPPLPDAELLLVDRLLARDHADERTLAAGLGFGASRAEAERRAGEAAREIAARAESAASAPASAAAGGGAARGTAESARSELGAEAYAKAVARAKEHIAAGDAYQICLTRRIEAPFAGDAGRLYRALRERSPAPFAAQLALPEAWLLSSSPERLLALGPDGEAESRPIKGTRPRGGSPERDRALRDALAASEKDRAENVMIADLVRNDLGRVCEVGSVEVPELCAIEPYATVFQMVSTVRGRLREGCDALDLLRAASPPGSMTGAPKLAAMRILRGLEPSRRGPYAGALGYLDARGGMGLAVVIRTLLLRGGLARLHTGGGVVADSRPETEWEESEHKARALLEVLRSEA